jgi:hypothetical protein
MAGQLRQVPLHVPEGDALAVLLEGTEHVGGDELDGLDHAHGMDCRRLWPGWSKITFVPTASVKRTSRDTGCAGIGDLRLHPKCPVVQV